MPDEPERLAKVGEVGKVVGVAAPMVSVVITCGFVALLILWLFHPPSPNDQVLALLVGTLAASFTQVVNYWLGSSIGSASKDNTISRIAVDTPTVAAKFVTDKVASEVNITKESKSGD